MSEKQFLRHGLNGNQLKLIAVISMLCDHAAIRLLAYGLIPALWLGKTWQQSGGTRHSGFCGLWGAWRFRFMCSC